MYLAYSTDTESTLIDRRLFLSQEWVTDPQRCRQAGIPSPAQVYRSKAALGLEMILAARHQAVPFDFVGMDAHYGGQPWLLTHLEREQIVYMADIPSSTRVYREAARLEGPTGRDPAVVVVASAQGPGYAARCVVDPLCRRAGVAH